MHYNVLEERKGERILARWIIVWYLRTIPTTFIELGPNSEPWSSLVPQPRIHIPKTKAATAAVVHTTMPMLRSPFGIAPEEPGFSVWELTGNPASLHSCAIAMTDYQINVFDKLGSTWNEVEMRTVNYGLQATVVLGWVTICVSDTVETGSIWG